MERINVISFDNVLPQVFRGAISNDAAIRHSDVWLRCWSMSRPGGFLIEAESGSGKSSMCSFIYGNRRDYEGTIRFNDVDIRSLSVDQWCDIRRRHLSILPQELRLFGELTVRQNLLLKNRLTDYLPEAEIRRLIERLGLEAHYDRPAALLSVGQQQRVAIVRALCQPFDFILLDEPVSHLDRANNLIAAAMIAEAAGERGAAVISTSVGNPLLLDELELSSPLPVTVIKL